MRCTILLLIFFVFNIASCSYDNIEEKYPKEPNFCETTGLRYSIEIKSIVDLNCATANCHNPAGGQLPFLHTIEGLKNNEMEVRVRINLPEGSIGKMPLIGNLSDCNKDKIDAWYDDGAPQ